MAKNTKKEKSPSVVVKFPKKTIQFILGLVILFVLIYFGKKVFFAASVNGRLISRSSVIKELEKQGGQKVLDTIILKTLINQEAKKRKLSVSQKELDGELQKIEKTITTQGSSLDSLLLQQGMTKGDLESEIKLQLLVTKMVGDDVSITDKEIEDYLTNQKEQSVFGSNKNAPELTKDQAKAAIKQQKIQAKIQTFISDLKAKAKINYFIKY